jgi:HEPN domain-containing protein
MPAHERALAVVRGWVEKAENDLANASLVLRSGRRGPMDTVAFHAQQCAEKYLKALLSFRGIDFPKIHDVEELLARTQMEVAAIISVEEQRLLTDYATVTRYPGDYEPVSVTEARRAVTLARRVRALVRKQLPSPALRPRRNRTRGA